MYNKTISVLIPVHNAAKTLIPLIEQILAFLPQYVSDYEIIIVDDQSSDQTPIIADNLAANYEPILIMHQPRRQGYAHSLLKAATPARGEYLLIADTNGQMSIEQIAHLLPYMDQYDMITSYPRDYQIAWLERSLSTLINTLFHLEQQPSTSYLMLVRAALLREHIFAAKGALILTEMYAKATSNNQQCIQIGIERRLTVAHYVKGTGYAQASQPTSREIIHVWQRLYRDNRSLQHPFLWFVQNTPKLIQFAALRAVWKGIATIKMIGRMG